MLNLIPHLLLWPSLLALVVVIVHEVSSALRLHGGHLVYWQSDRDRLANMYMCLSVAARHKLNYADTLVHCAADGGPGWYVRDLARAAVQLNEGKSFIEAAASAPAVFSVSDRVVLETAEQEGRLAECFEALSLPRPASRSLFVPVLLIAVEIAACLVTNWWMVYGTFDSLRARLSYDFWTPWDPDTFITSWLGLGSDYRVTLGFAVCGGLVVWLLARARHAEAFQRYFFAVSKILQLSYWLPVLRQFAYSAGVAVRAGIQAPAAVRAAIDGTGNPLLRAREKAIVGQLEEGKPVADAVAVLPTLPVRFVSGLRKMKGGAASPDAWLALAGDECLRGRRLLEKWALFLIVLVYPIWGVAAAMMTNFFTSHDESGNAIAVMMCAVWLITLFAMSVGVLMIAIFHTRE